MTTDTSEKGLEILICAAPMGRNLGLVEKVIAGGGVAAGFEDRDLLSVDCALDDTLVVWVGRIQHPL